MMRWYRLHVLLLSCRAASIFQWILTVIQGSSNVWCVALISCFWISMLLQTFTVFVPLSLRQCTSPKTSVRYVHKMNWRHRHTWKALRCLDVIYDSQLKNSTAVNWNTIQRKAWPWMLVWWSISATEKLIYALHKHVQVKICLPDPVRSGSVCPLSFCCVNALRWNQYFWSRTA